jgi:hypothetical protein
MSMSVDEVRRQMAQIRTAARGTAVQLRQGTEQFLDWKHYVRMYPWAVVGGSLILGYLLVPKRSAAPRVAPTDGAADQPAAQAVKKAGIFAAFAGLAMTAAKRAAMAYASQQVSKFLNTRSASVAAAPKEVHEYSDPLLQRNQPPDPRF